jgi:hypothetical protein
MTAQDSPGSTIAMACCPDRPDARSSNQRPASGIGAGSRLGLDIARITYALRRGSKIANIAKSNGCSITTILEIRKEQGIPLRHPRMSQETINDIVARLKAGEKHLDIAKAVGATRSAVGRIAMKVGLRRLTDTSKLPHHAIEEAFKLGRSCRSIAAELGCHDETISRILKWRGVDVSEWGVKATDRQVRACQLAGMTPAAAARHLGVKPAGFWYARWKRIAAGIPKQQGPKKP